MAAETHGGSPRDETIRVSPETRERLLGWSDADRHEDEVLAELLDQVERETTTWPPGDYY